MPTKQILAAGIVQDICFSCMEARNKYLRRLDSYRMNYQLVDTYERQDGSVIIRIIKPYNGSDVIRI